MIYIDLSNEKEKKKLSSSLERYNIDHNDISVCNNKKNSNIIIIDNNLDKIKEYRKKIKNIIIYNKNKDSLIDKVYYENGIYSFSVVEELKTIIDVINDRKNASKSQVKRLVTTSFVLLLLIVVLISSPKLLSGINKNVSTSSSKSEDTSKKVEKENKEITDYGKENFVFYGDSITEMYSVEKFFGDLPVVNAGHGGYHTTHLLKEMDEKLLVYNPTKVFMLMGTNDLAYSNLSNEEIVDNIAEIVHNLKKDRKKVKIYIESIYPVKETKDFDPGVWHVRENARIREINDMLKKLCKKEKLTYIDVYDKLQAEDGSLRDDYTIEGLHINEDGYQVITDTLLEYVKEA